ELVTGEFNGRVCRLFSGLLRQVGSICGVLRTPDDSCYSGGWAVGGGWSRVRSSLLRRCRETWMQIRAAESTVDCRCGVEMVSRALAARSCASLCQRTPGLNMTLARLRR